MPPLTDRARRMTACALVKVCRSGKPTQAKERVNRALDLLSLRGLWSHLAASVTRWALQERVTDITHTHDSIANTYTFPAPWDPPATIFISTELRDSKANLSSTELYNKAKAAIDLATPDNAVSYYTDGSVNPHDNTCGCSFYCQDTIQLWRLTYGCSTMQTELVAISKALNHAVTEHDRPVIVHTDSKASYQALQCRMPKDNINLITTILGQLQQLQQQGRQVVLHWIPSHVGIRGNEIADEAAQAATHFSGVQIKVQPSLAQLKRHVKSSVELLLRKNVLDAFHAGSESATWYLTATRCKPFEDDRRLSRRAQVNLF